MSRGTTPGAPIRHRLGDALPAMFLDDAFIQRFCDGLDDVLAPVPSTLDSFSAFLDPQLTPADFLEWLAGWVGIEIDRTWPIERRRAMVANAATLYRRRGTVAGLADLVELFLGVRPDIVEGGGVAWSRIPGASIPGTDGGTLVVRLQMAEPNPSTVAKLDRLVGANKPAHLSHRVEFVRAAPVQGGLKPLPPPTKEQA